MGSESKSNREERKERAIERKIVRKSRKRIRSRVGFVWHFAVFAFANTALVAINLNYDPGALWFVWPLGAWGAGLAAHAMAVFLFTGTTDAMVAQEIEKEKLRRGLLPKTN
jgi:hypothetical protein